MTLRKTADLAYSLSTLGFYQDGRWSELLTLTNGRKTPRWRAGLLLLISEPQIVDILETLQADDFPNAPIIIVPLGVPLPTSKEAQTVCGTLASLHCDQPELSTRHLYQSFMLALSSISSRQNNMKDELQQTMQHMAHVYPSFKTILESHTNGSV